MDALPTLASVQHTIAYSIYRLGVVADKYTSVEGLAEKILLPAVLKEVREGTSEYIKIEWILRSRIFDPLKDFGLVECKYNVPMQRSVLRSGFSGRIRGTPMAALR